MKCKIEDCGNEIRYKELQLCQKHYFRLRRNGHLGLSPKSRKYRLQNPAGYQSIYQPKHILADHQGYVYEHRFIVYEKYEHVLPDCEICGKTISWDNCHIDHKDDDVTNNKIENLRPVCPGCNTSRTERSSSDRMEYQGRKLTFTQWAIEPGVTACRNQIRARYKKGISPHDCLFMPNKTHPKT